jgi:hypothetical protein
MTVAIATLHRATNFGAFLQAFALQEFLRQSGADASFLDLDSSPSQYRVLRRSVSQAMKTGTFSFRQAHVFRRAVAQYLRISKQHSHPDTVFVGSDEVWNVRNPTFRPQPAFFGLGLDGARVCSYAPSMGQSTAADLAAHPDYVQGLRGMHRLSGRDANTTEAVAQLTGRHVLRVVDPTFLIDWKSFARPSPVENALVVYTYALSPERVLQVRELASRHGWRIVTPGLGHAWADVNLVCDPFEFIGLLQNAPAVLTDTFHGTIFSVLTRARFGILGPVQKNKLRNLVSELDLGVRVVETTAEMDAVFSQPSDSDPRTGSFGERIGTSVAYLHECLTTERAAQSGSSVATAAA